MTTAFERNWAIQPSLKTRQQQEQDARHQRDRRHELRRLVAGDAGHEHGTPGDRGKDELGPVEICREVQKSA